MFIVLLASHLTNPLRKKTIQYALQSVAEQTIKPDKVMISYSGDKNDEENWRKILNQIDTDIFYHPNQRQQFEHYFFLHKFVKDDDVVMFLDDDDLYNLSKVERTKQEFTNNPAIDYLQHKIRRFGQPYDPEKIIHGTTSQIQDMLDTGYKIERSFEYHTKAVRGKLFKDFFNVPTQAVQNKTFQQLLDEYKGITDLAFNVYVDAEAKHKHKIDDVLYYYRATPIKKDYRTS